MDTSAPLESAALQVAQMDGSFIHLQAELARIDVLIRRQVHRWQQAGQDPADSLRGLSVSDRQVDTLLSLPFAGNWSQLSAREATREEDWATVYDETCQYARSVAETVRQQGHVPRLLHLATVFGLDQLELNAFLICLAPALDLRYTNLYSYLQDDVTRKWPSVNLILDLLVGPGPQRLPLLSYFAPDSTLSRYELLSRVNEPGMAILPLLGQSLKVDDAVAAWLLGRYQPHAELDAHATLQWPETTVRDQLLAAEMKGQLAEAIHGQSVAFFHGPDHESQAAVTRLFAVSTGRPLLSVDLPAVVASGVAPLRAVRLALRDARLAAAMAYLKGWDVCLGESTPASELLQEVLEANVPVVISGEREWYPQGVARSSGILHLAFPKPGYTQRLALWRHFLAETAATDSVDVTTLAGQFSLTSSQIRDAVASARDMAIQRGGKVENRDLYAAARAHSSPSLAGLAHKIEPRYDWVDIVLPAEQLQMLREISAHVQGQALVMEKWGIDRKLKPNTGITVLFAGPPGTGKTMAAEVIAAELGLDLYRIDLSTVVSKYIGETEKNLGRIFDEAQDSSAILFFDEADAIFGKRSEVKDAHDRYANIEVSYLLQRMEMYDGVTILATNLRANMDEAFTRRIQFIVNFPFPDEGQRLRIWQTLFPRDVPLKEEIDFALLARRYKLTGGNIRNIIVNAAYLAAVNGGVVTMEHLLHGTRRELQKMGRLISDVDLSIP